MYGRLLGLFGLIAAFVLTAQLRGTSLLNPSPRTTAAMAAFLAGVAVLAAVVSGGLRRRRQPRWHPPASPYGDNQRQTFRIVYPEAERPQLVTGRGAGRPYRFTVVDLSEEGLRLADAEGRIADGELAGELEFGDGRRAQVAGTVVRRAPGEVCLHLTSTVPPNLVVEEQLRLRKREHARAAGEAGDG